MSNTFKVNDKVTVNEDLGFIADMVTCDTTEGTQYTVVLIGNPMTGKPDDITFIDDAGDKCCVYPESVTLVEEL